MLDKKKSISVAVLSLITMLAASPAHAHDWGQEDYHYRHYKDYYRHHHRHYDYRGYPSYGRIVIRLPGKFVGIVIAGKRYYHCDGEYYRRNGRYFEIVPSPYGSSMAGRYEGYDRGDDGDYRDYRD